PHLTETYTLSLHDALPICIVGSAQDRRGRRGSLVELSSLGEGAETGQPRVAGEPRGLPVAVAARRRVRVPRGAACAEPLRNSGGDRKSTRLNSSHLVISYA